MNRISYTLGGKRRYLSLPPTKVGRIAIGLGLVLGGILGFLPIVGFWMFPLGLAILSIDVGPLRRIRRRLTVWWMRRRNRDKRVS